MFCPRCATQNLDDAKFCRACGADIQLVPQALAGTLPVAAAAAGRKGAREKGERDPRLLEKGMENIFSGVALLLIFLGGLFWFTGGFMIWVWFIIPALGCIGKGLGQLLRSRREHRLLLAGARPALYDEEGDEGDERQLPRAGFGELAAADTAEMADSPFSVTEATTRHLAAARRPDDAPRKV